MIEVVECRDVALELCRERLQGAHGHFPRRLKGAGIDLSVNSDFTPFPYQQPHPQDARSKNRRDKTACRSQRSLDPSLRKGGQIKTAFEQW